MRPLTAAYAHPYTPEQVEPPTRVDRLGGAGKGRSVVDTRDSRRQAITLARRTAVAVAGGTLTMAGIVLLFIPGPGLLVLLLGLSILATEFGWARQARQWLHREARGIAPLPQGHPPPAARAMATKDLTLRRSAKSGRQRVQGDGSPGWPCAHAQRQ